MRVLVITPTLGRSIFLEETVSSVAAIEFQVEHRLVCPPREVDALKGRFPWLRVIGAQPRGVYAAIEAGFEEGGEWDAWTWINDDDRLRPGAATRAWSILEAAPDVDIVYGRVNYIGSAGRCWGPLPVESDPSRLRSLFAAEIPGMSQHGTLVRRSLALRIGRFAPGLRLAADFDYWARAVLSGARFMYHPEVVAEYRLHDGQLSSDTDKVSAEVHQSVARWFAEAKPGGRRAVRLLFRVRHLPDLARRFIACGCVRTSAMYRKANRSGGRR